MSIIDRWPLSSPDPLPDWLKLNPKGPHQRATGFNAVKDGVACYCTKCGTRWRDCKERS